MNERIRELAEHQAGSILMDLIMPDSGMPERIKWNIGCTTEHLKYFAELIVRECADIADRRPNVLINQTVGGWIKQHFGVES
jgi:hypothetical protein